MVVTSLRLDYLVLIVAPPAPAGKGLAPWTGGPLVSSAGAPVRRRVGDVAPRLPTASSGTVVLGHVLERWHLNRTHSRRRPTPSGNLEGRLTMIHRLTIVTSAATAAVLLLLTGTGPASAADDFGQHVTSCVRSMGFDGQHNPGMHRGYSGWSADHIC